MIDKDKCDLCGECVNLCPFHSLEIVEGEVRQVRDCYLCGVCIALCKRNAIRLIPNVEVKEIKTLGHHNHRG